MAGSEDGRSDSVASEDESGGSVSGENSSSGAEDGNMSDTEDDANVDSEVDVGDVVTEDEDGSNDVMVASAGEVDGEADIGSVETDSFVDVEGDDSTNTDSDVDIEGDDSVDPGNALSDIAAVGGAVNTGEGELENVDSQPFPRQYNNPRHRHKCSVCRKTFTSQRSLQRHLVVHKEKRPYKCQWCGRCFKRKSYLPEHYRIHQQIPHECPFCDKVFNAPSYVLRHIRRCHKE